MEAVFNMYDVEQQGWISMKNLVDRAREAGITKEDVQRLFAGLDKSGDDKIDLVVRWNRSPHASPSHSFVNIYGTLTHYIVLQYPSCPLYSLR